MGDQKTLHIRLVRLLAVTFCYFFLIRIVFLHFFFQIRFSFFDYNVISSYIILDLEASASDLNSTDDTIKEIQDDWDFLELLKQLGDYLIGLNSVQYVRLPGTVGRVLILSELQATVINNLNGPPTYMAKL